MQIFNKQDLHNKFLKEKWEISKRAKKNKKQKQNKKKKRNFCVNLTKNTLWISGKIKQKKLLIW